MLPDPFFLPPDPFLPPTSRRCAQPISAHSSPTRPSVSLRVAAALPPFPLRIEIRFQCDGVVVFGMASAVEKSDVLFARRVQQWLPHIGMSIQFLCVSALKLRPFLQIRARTICAAPWLARPLSHTFVRSDSFFIPRGQRRSTKKRAPSIRAGGS